MIKKNKRRARPPPPPRTQSRRAHPTLTRRAGPTQPTDLYRLQRLQVPGEAKSEELDSIEVGLRGRWNRISYETNVFYMQKENYYFRDAMASTSLMGRR